MSDRRAPFPMNRHPRKPSTAVKKPPFLKPKPPLIGPPTRAARKLRQAQLGFRSSAAKSLSSAVERVAAQRHNTIIPPATPTVRRTPNLPTAPSVPLIPIPSTPAPAAAALPSVSERSDRSARLHRQDAIAAISAIARSEAEQEEAASPSKWCTKEQMALVYEFIGDYRTAGNSTRRRETAHRFYDVWFQCFPPVFDLVERGLLPFSTLRPTHVMTRAQQLIVADEQKVIRKKLAAVFQDEYEKWESLDWYEFSGDEDEEDDDAE